MVESAHFPPDLPKHLQHERGSWLGMDPYSPHLEVVKGPSSDKLRRAYQEKKKVALTLESRTADMEEEDLNDQEGDVEVEIRELYELEGGFFNFLAAGKLPYVGESIMWVWEYMPGFGAAADLLVKD